MTTRRRFTLSTEDETLGVIERTMRFRAVFPNVEVRHLHAVMVLAEVSLQKTTFLKLYLRM